MRFAYRQLGKPYRWGAAGPQAYDCSGLAVASWRKAGARLPRISTQQYRAVGRKVARHRLRPGDLMFFHGRGHVGIYVGRGRYIHSPRSGRTVSIDKFDGHRRRAFSGAVRPGAPRYRTWPSRADRPAELRRYDRLVRQYKRKLRRAARTAHRRRR